MDIERERDREKRDRKTEADRQTDRQSDREREGCAVQIKLLAMMAPYLRFVMNNAV